MRVHVIVVAALGLAACAPTVPDSGAGVGFQDYNSYLRGREAGSVASPQASAAPLSPFSTDAASAAIDKADGLAPPAAQTPYVAPVQPSYTTPADGERARGNAPAGIEETTSEMDPAPQAGVSDEQDFQAVKQRETIESDKARIERNRAQYQVDQPTALPQRPGDTGPNIVAFALATSHPVGTMMYKRSKIGLSSQARACAQYASPDIAQEAFLSNGGPEKDRKGVDPDGDGFACSWDPTPFRSALK
ncbi:MAG: hypothetical protein V9G14_06350 [Cypionkella sp.]